MVDVVAQVDMITQVVDGVDGQLIMSLKPIAKNVAVYATDKKFLKIGDGVHAYASLPVALDFRKLISSEHTHVPKDVGLGFVQNLPIADAATANEMVSNSAYMNIKLLYDAVRNKIPQLLGYTTALAEGTQVVNETYLAEAATVIQAALDQMAETGANRVARASEAIQSVHIKTLYDRLVALDLSIDEHAGDLTQISNALSTKYLVTGIAQTVEELDTKPVVGKPVYDLAVADNAETQSALSAIDAALIIANQTIASNPIITTITDVLDLNSDTVVLSAKAVSDLVALPDTELSELVDYIEANSAGFWTYETTGTMPVNVETIEADTILLGSTDFLTELEDHVANAEYVGTYGSLAIESTGVITVGTTSPYRAYMPFTALVGQGGPNPDYFTTSVMATSAAGAVTTVVCWGDLPADWQTLSSNPDANSGSHDTGFIIFIGSSSSYAPTAVNLSLHATYAGVGEYVVSKQLK